tara:strand:- start:32 stop:229 length:198 start_codon:yes stop_codon:yes gene_type:complete
MISLLIYLVTEYDIFEVVKNISSGNVNGYSLWEKLFVQLIFALDVFLFTVMFIIVFIFAIRSVYL